MELIEKYWIYGLGFLSQALFGTRLLVQLFHTERQGKVVSPTIFWQLSLIASFLFLVYGILRDDFTIILGQLLAYFIYVRNLQIKNEWKKIPLVLRALLAVLPIVAFLLTATSANKLTALFHKSDLADPIVIIGGIGQLLLNVRFVYQWYHAEKSKTSILPIGFWIMSVIAAIMIIRYALYITPKKTIDPVLLLSASMGMVVYVRNIMIHFKSKSTAARADID